MSEFTIQMRQNRVTKGAVRYGEIDADGNEVELRDAKIGQLYIRKSAFLNENLPDQIEVSIHY